MAFYRIGEPGADGFVHINFGRAKKRGGEPSPCVAPMLKGDHQIPRFGQRCYRMAVALCDGPAGQDHEGRALTCDAPVCERHRTRGGADVDYCPRHAHLAPATLPLAAETSS